MKKKLLSIMILMFTSGALIGFFGGRQLQHHKNMERMRRRQCRGIKQQQKQILTHFSKKLHLSKSQQKSAGPIIEKMLKQVQRIEEKTRPQKKRLMNSFRTDLRAILNESQAKKFNKMYKKRKSQLFPLSQRCKPDSPRKHPHSLSPNKSAGTRQKASRVIEESVKP
jgi:uncharacterized membrane-anchored protein YhcB (DUF1043 family)